MQHDSSSDAGVRVVASPLARQWQERPGLVCAALVMVAGLVYVNALHNPFVFDDHVSVVENASIQPPLHLRTLVLHAVTRPLINLSYAIDRAIWGSSPFGFHLTNVLLHMLNVALLFVLARRLTEDRMPGNPSSGPPIVTAAAAATLFAVHPMMSEAVGYISGRSELLCATFFLLGVLCARRWMRCDGAGWLLLSVCLWIAALATKEIAAMFPVVLLCYDRFILGGSGVERRRRLLKLHLPLMTLALLAGMLRVAVFAFVEAPGGMTVHWPYALVVSDVVRRYFMLILAPRSQSIFHAVPAIGGLLTLRALMALGGMGLIVALAWRVRRFDGIASLGVFWFLVLLVPSSVLVMLDRGEPMAEHRVYLAGCGLFLTAGAGVGWLGSFLEQARPQARLLMRASLAAGFFLLCGATLLRNAVWASPVTLWLEAVDLAPDQWRPWLMLGEALHNAGRREEAIVAYKTGLALRPQEQWGYMKLGLCQAELGKLEEASATFEQLLKLDPRSEVALAGLGAVAMLAGQPDRARRYFLETIERHPRNIAARQSMAMLEETVADNPAEALQRCREIQQLAPGTPGNDECIRRNQSRLAAAGSPERDPAARPLR